MSQPKRSRRLAACGLVLLLAAMGCGERGKSSTETGSYHQPISPPGPANSANGSGTGAATGGNVAAPEPPSQ